jgi:hypothetical protein
MQANHDLKRHGMWEDRTKVGQGRLFLYGFPWDSSIFQYETQRHEKIKYIQPPNLLTSKEIVWNNRK